MTHDQADGGRDDAGPAADAMDRALRSAARMHADDQVVKALRISIGEVAPGRATARMRVTADMVNGHGIAHGGYLFLLADAAFAYACNSHGPVTVARQCEITFLRPAREGDDLTAAASERVRIERNGIYDVSVRRANGEVLAEMRGHSRMVRPGPGGAGESG
ncbi:MAG TPA: hydroxyphenylacetyl-CoA thioesterase PaaI [Streptosporangiaceae bacterium]|nr:hydroxyphenylacetyl-CoA thioesterase PaaI [Streptosporangiaceae bacterium]